MHYTVNNLAKLSNVTTRTIRFYDTIGLLKPAHVTDNGYRCYEEAQLLRLQQILFFKELGFELKHIQETLNQNDFNQRESLKAHKRAMLESIKRIRGLIQTIDKTLNHLDGSAPISTEDIFSGFATFSNEHAAMQTKLVDNWTKHFGEQEGRQQLKNSIEITRHWTVEELNHYYGRAQKIVAELFKKLTENIAPEAPEVQDLIQTHCELLEEVQPVTKGYYLILATYFCDPTQKEQLEKEHPGVAEYMAQAMRIFAETNL